MAECDILNESLPDLLGETLEGDTREQVYRHIESCEPCRRDWSAYKAIWTDLDWTETEPPARLRENFLKEVAVIGGERRSNVVAFPRFRALSRAAAVFLVLLVGFYAGRETVTDSPNPVETPASLTSIEPAESFGVTKVVAPAELARMLHSDAQVRNVSLVNEGDEATVTFDLNSEVAVRADLSNPAFSKLMARAVSSPDHPSHERGRMIDWIRANHSEHEPSPDIMVALLSVLKSDSHEGVRIRALDALRELPMSPDQATQMRTGLVDVLQNDPNPAIRMKAVDVLAAIATEGFVTDPGMLESLREKVEQDDENMYVRVRAAEALRQMKF